jgi:hypothetical protein
MTDGGGNETAVNNQSKPLPYEFVSLNLKGRTNGFSLKGGDATQGAFRTMYSGPRPKAWTGPRHPGGYQPMQKQGAIILATGGDQSNSAKGKFYEGFMASGSASDEVDELVKANIVGVKYKVLG